MIRKGYADCSEGQIHYRETGRRGQPVVCFFHQTASSGVMWEKVISRLGESYHCYSFDSPGFGQSYQPEHIPDVAFMAERMMEAITSLGVEQFHAVGHHTGGCAALEMPGRHKGRLKSLTLVGPVLVNDAEKAEYRKTFVRPFAAEPSGDFLKTAWDYLAMIGAAANLELHLREMVDHLIAHRTMPMAFSGVWNQDVAGLYRAIDVPLFIMCSKDDVLWPLFERAKEMRPDARSAIVGGADFQPDNDPESVTRELQAFLTDVENGESRS